MRLIISCCLFVIACTDRQAKPAPTTSPIAAAAPTAKPVAAPTVDAAPKPAAGLAGTIDGKPVVFTHAIAVDRKHDVEISLFNYEYTCSDKFNGGSSRSSTPEDVELAILVGKSIDAGGKVGWGIYQRNLIANGVTAYTGKEDGAWPIQDAAIDVTKGATFPLALDFVPPEEDGKNKLALKGTMQITSCGEDPKRPAEPDPAPIGDGTIEIAGLKLPVGGAGIIVKRSGERELEVSTHPVKCVDGSDYVSSWGDVRVHLEWMKNGTLYDQQIGGRWVGWANNQKDMTLTASPNRPSGKEMKIKLGGTTTINGIAVALSGTVPAIVCPTPK